MKETTVKAPGHLASEGKRFWQAIAGAYDLEAHHEQLLLRACEFIDAIARARKSLKAAGGDYYQDRFGQPRPRPEIAVMRDSSIALARCLRELNLDADMVPADSRPPTLARNTRGVNYA
jgi:hypothetical protein